MAVAGTVRAIGSGDFRHAQDNRHTYLTARPRQPGPTEQTQRGKARVTGFAWQDHILLWRAWQISFAGTVRGSLGAGALALAEQQRETVIARPPG